MTRLEKDLAALETLSLPHLRERWGKTGTDVAPAVPAALLRRLLAQRLQEKRHGNLPLLIARELERAVATGRKVTSDPPLRTLVLTAGTRLIREWNGQTIAVEVTEAGFVWKDCCYRSLSEIAREVTGAHWSGPRFFGLNRRG